MRILVARHGQTEWNLAGKIQGSGDSPLTDLGRSQAQHLGQVWQRLGVRQVYSSPLGRAVMTARLAAEVLGQDLQGTEPGLAERAFGAYEGVPISQLRQQHAACDDIILGLQPGLAAPGGETLQAVAARVNAALVRLATTHPEQTLGLVTHGHCLLGLVWHLQGEPADIRQFHHRNVSYSELEWTDGQLQVLRWAVSDHLLT